MSLLFLLGQIAFADDFESTITAAQKSMDEGNYEQMLVSLQEAKVLAGKSTRIFTSEELVQIYWIEALSYFKRKEIDASIEPLRHALMLKPNMEFTNPITSDAEYRDVFLGVQNEVRHRETLDSNIPKEYGFAEIYINGVAREHGHQVSYGEHFTQIKCPRGDVHSNWHFFKNDGGKKKSIDWLALCPYTFNTQPPCPPVNDDPLNMDPFAEKIDPTKCQAANAEIGKKAPVTLPKRKINTNLLIGSAVTTVAAGTLYYLALEERKKFDNLGEGAITSEDELRSLQGDINTKVYISAGLGGVAIGLWTGAFWKGKF